jgi:hypothetical protein
MGKGAKTVGWIGAACVVCCVGPIVGLIASASATTVALMLTGLGGAIVGAVLVIVMLRLRSKRQPATDSLEAAVTHAEIK